MIRVAGARREEKKNLKALGKIQLTTSKPRIKHWRRLMLYLRVELAGPVQVPTYSALCMRYETGCSVEIGTS